MSCVTEGLVHSPAIHPMSAAAIQAGAANSQRLSGELTAVALKYQQILAENPSKVEALIGMSLIAMVTGQAIAAVDMARAAIAAAPQAGIAWVALGQALKVNGHLGEAEAAYERALSLNHNDALAHLGLGELRMASSRPEEATGHFDAALRRQPALVAAHMAFAHALASIGRDRDALERYRHVLLLAPDTAEAEFAVAFVQARLGNAEAAEAHYRRALKLRPDFAAAWMNLGCLLREQGRPLHAEAALVRAVELRPGTPAGWLNLALLKREQKRESEAEQHLQRAFALDPRQIETLIAWCQFRLAEKDMAGAWAWLRWAEARGPSHPEVANTRGILLHVSGRFAEAVRAFECAETLGSEAAASNRGNSLLDMGLVHEAHDAHARAVALAPHSAGAAYNLALTRLRLGDWKRGWAGYEARWRFREVHPAPMLFRQPRWHGEPIGGRRILLHAEQGLGDAIQFCRYASLVAARGAQVILQVHAPLERLMLSLPAAHAGSVCVTRLGEQPPVFDIECPLMSLPAVFGTTVETVPWAGPYLGADPEISSELALSKKGLAGIAQASRAPRIGIAWAGNPRYKSDARRSTQLATLVPLIQRFPSAEWISLQKGVAAEQLRQLPDDVRVLDGASEDRDLADAAALLATLDLVLTTDTSIAHLAGAMGKPVWILLPHLSDWRWMQDVETTPWYPTARLFRQNSPGDWGEVLERTAAELEWLRLKHLRLHAGGYRDRMPSWDGSIQG